MTVHHAPVSRRRKEDQRTAKTKGNQQMNTIATEIHQVVNVERIENQSE